MDRGSYIAANGMIAQQQRLDVLSNNLANVNTRGFKSDRLTFGDMMLRTLADRGGDGDPIATLSSGPETKSESTDFQQGAVETTGNPLDMCLSGKSVAMFAVRHKSASASDSQNDLVTRDGARTGIDPQGRPTKQDDGIRYTRNGSFTLNASNDLVTQDGDAVLDASGAPIKGVRSPVSIDAKGRIATERGPVEIGRFVGGFSKDQDGMGLYRSESARVAEARDEVKLESGALEASNVNPVLAMVDMISLQRAYEISQKMIQSQDESTAKLAETMS